MADSHLFFSSKDSGLEVDFQIKAKVVSHDRPTLLTRRSPATTKASTSTSSEK
jgi:hypothetical protein